MTLLLASCGKGLEYVLRLRPCQEDDAAFVYELRKRAAVSRYLNDPPNSIACQLAWMRQEREFAENMNFICEDRHATPLGTIAVYNVAGQSAEWGRWVMVPGSLAAFASVANLFTLCFTALNFETLWSWTAADNRDALAIHRALGLRPAPEANKVLVNAGGQHVLLAHRADSTRWPAIRKASSALALGAERFLGRG